jgi:hypothetical protein
VLGRNIPLNMSMSVDLPAPLGPHEGDFFAYLNGDADSLQGHGFISIRIAEISGFKDERHSQPHSICMSLVETEMAAIAAKYATTAKSASGFAFPACSRRSSLPL